MISKYSQIKSLYPKKKKKIEHIKLKQCVSMQVSKYVIRKIDTCTSKQVHRSTSCAVVSIFWPSFIPIKIICKYGIFHQRQLDLPFIQVNLRISACFSLDFVCIRTLQQNLNSNSFIGLSQFHSPRHCIHSSQFHLDISLVHINFTWTFHWLISISPRHFIGSSQFQLVILLIHLNFTWKFHWFILISPRRFIGSS